MTSIIKNIIIVLGLLMIGGVGYYLFVIEREATVATGGFGASGVTANTEVILSRLADLQTIQLPSEIFNDPRFRSLEDNSRVVDRVPVGRELPFSENTEPISILDLIGN